jgi:purine nucleoside permease
MSTRCHRWLTVLAGIALLARGLTGAAAEGAPTATDAAVASPAAVPRPVKVLVINLFGLEAAPWIKALQPTEEIRVPGLSAAYPLVRCTTDGVCQMTTDMGHANAAASLMAVLFSGRFDLHEAYFLVAGIAGIDPGQGTIGTAAWARYVVDGGIAHEIDAREMPRGWHDGYFGMLTHSPEAVPALDYHSEVFRLDERLLQQAMKISAPVSLRDSPGLASYRGRYREAAARRPPRVTQCDTLSADTWWAGRRLGERASRWTRLVTEGKGVYCTSQEEDNAVMVSLSRGAQAGLIDVTRVAVLRGGSDFDRPYPGAGRARILENTAGAAGCLCDRRGQPRHGRPARGAGDRARLAGVARGCSAGHARALSAPVRRCARCRRPAGSAGV